MVEEERRKERDEGLQRETLNKLREGLLREFAMLKCTRDHIMQQFRPEIKVPAEVARKQFERYGHEFGRAEELYQRYMHDEVVRGERDAMANSFSGEKVMFLQTETRCNLPDVDLVSHAKSAISKQINCPTLNRRSLKSYRISYVTIPRRENGLLHIHGRKILWYWAIILNS